MIRKAEHDDLDNIMLIIKDTIEEMQANGNDQWNENYPVREDFDADIKMGELYVEEGNGQIIGLICVNYIEPDEYSGINWSSNEKAMVIHRMAVNISSRTKGIGTNLMAFAEELAIGNNVKYLKTDTYSLNHKMNRLLEKNGFKRIGEMSFHGKENSFYCYDKFLNFNSSKSLDNDAIHILNKLVGPLDRNTASKIMQAIDCFFHPEVSLFIPSYGQCKYAVTPNHTHPAYSFIYYFQPVYDFIIEGKNLSYDLAEGKCLSAISPDIPHQEMLQDNFQSYIAIMIDRELFHQLISQYVQTVPVFHGESFSPHPELLGVLKCFMLEASAGRNGNTELLDHLSQVITHLTIRSVVSETQQTVPLYDRFEVDQAIAYMNSHFSEKITIDDLANQAARSSGHFSKIFKSVTGMTPMDYLSMVRIQKARNSLIHSMKSITEIAMECGFNTSSYFSSCFLEKYKMTPSAFRKNFQQKVQSSDFDKISRNFESE